MHKLWWSTSIWSLAPGLLVRAHIAPDKSCDGFWTNKVMSLPFERRTADNDQRLVFYPHVFFQGSGAGFPAKSPSNPRMRASPAIAIDYRGLSIVPKEPYIVLLRILTLHHKTRSFLCSMALDRKAKRGT